MKTNEYPIKRPIDETDCEECSARLRVGMIAVEAAGMLFCSEECAAYQSPTPEHPRGSILGLPVECDLSEDPDAIDQFLDDMYCAICDMEGLPKPIRRGLLFPA